MGGVSFAPVVGFPGYLVSSDGDVYGPRKRLAGHTDRRGYVRVGLYANGVRAQKGVHVIVAEAFHGLRPSHAHDPDHVNHVRNDNRACNLRWLPVAENRRFGGGGKGERNANARLTAADAREIRRRRHAGERCVDLGAEFGVTKTTVSFIARGKTWSHI